MPRLHPTEKEKGRNRLPCHIRARPKAEGGGPSHRHGKGVRPAPRTAGAPRGRGERGAAGTDQGVVSAVTSAEKGRAFLTDAGKAAALTAQGAAHFWTPS